MSRWTGPGLVRLEPVVAWCCAALLLVGCVGPRQNTAAEREITVEWIYSDEAAAITALPTVQWLDDGQAILLDPRVPESSRTFERLDPSDGSRNTCLDMGQATAALRAVTGDDEAVLPRSGAIRAMPDGANGLRLVSKVEEGKLAT